MKKQITYLAAPYSHPDPAIRERRFRAINRAAAILIKSGKIVFSPISMSHPIAEAHGMPKGFDFWERQDLAFLDISREMIILPLAGWLESLGVLAEARFCLSRMIPVTVCSLQYPAVEDFIKKRTLMRKLRQTA